MMKTKSHGRVIDARESKKHHFLANNCTIHAHRQWETTSVRNKPIRQSYHRNINVAVPMPNYYTG